MNMCTVKEIREAIREDCRSQRNMETIEIDRIFQTLTFPQLGSVHIRASTMRAKKTKAKKITSSLS